MIVSFNEIETMGRRAARGAAMTWGMADEAGKSARWLAIQGLPGPELLAGLLDHQDGVDHTLLAPVTTEGTWSAPNGLLCPLVAGAALCDRAAHLGDGRAVVLGPTSYPALLAWHVASAATLTDRTLELRWTDVVMVFEPNGVARSSAEGGEAAIVAGNVAAVRCGISTGGGVQTTPRAGGWLVDESRWSRLRMYATRTFAPATEESRLTGAGAGLIDD